MLILQLKQYLAFLKFELSHSSENISIYKINLSFNSYFKK